MEDFGSLVRCKMCGEFYHKDAAVEGLCIQCREDSDVETDDNDD